jgi:hypothetical protein
MRVGYRAAGFGRDCLTIDNRSAGRPGTETHLAGGGGRFLESNPLAQHAAQAQYQEHGNGAEQDQTDFKSGPVLEDTGLHSTP